MARQSGVIRFSARSRYGLQTATIKLQGLTIKIADTRTRKTRSPFKPTHPAARMHYSPKDKMFSRSYRNNKEAAKAFHRFYREYSGNWHLISYRGLKPTKRLIRRRPTK